MKKVIVIVAGVILFLIIGSFAALFAFNAFLNKSVTGDDGVQAGYHTKLTPTTPLEAKYAKPGPYEVEHQFNNGEHLFYPKPGEHTPENFPLVVMSNGTHTPVSTYEPVLEHLAGWGFVVAGNEADSSGDGTSNSTTLDHAINQANDPESPLYQRILLDHIGMSGHSQGGAGAINAITNFENGKRYTSLYTASAIKQSIAHSNNWDYDTSKITIPYFMMTSTGNQDHYLISPLSSAQENYERITSNTPAILARRIDVDHKDVLEYGDAYMTACFLWTLSDDQEAKQVFVGDDAELLSNKDWQDVQMKNLPS